MLTNNNNDEIKHERDRKKNCSYCIHCGLRKIQTTDEEEINYLLQECKYKELCYHNNQ